LIIENKNTKMHNFKFNFSLLFFSVLIVFTGNSQNNVIQNPPDKIKSIVLRSKLTNNYTPIIRLGEGFTLEFDDLSYDQQEYSYKIEHYDYNWQPSGLISTEYINGYASDYIRDFENSFNTLQPYTYYKLEIPNDNTQIKLSGNYVISVLNNYDEVLFSRPFIVYDSQVDVGVSVHRSRDIASLNSKHSLQFTINHPNLQINNPSQEIKVAIYQNNDWNTVIKELKPQFYRASQLIYKYIDIISFWAGNEFLFFDTKQIRIANNNIARVTLNDIFDTYLYLDEERLHRPYTLYPDINGNFVIRSVDGGETSTEADYTWVHFSLETFENIGQDNIYVYGNFNGWQLTEENKMSFDERLKIYTCKLLLKQGFYNYLYVTANSEGKINNRAIEGSFFQTENDYTVLVYFRPFGSRYDQVIGYGNANSENLRN
jgi:hypothetical protein